MTKKVMDLLSSISGIVTSVAAVLGTMDVIDPKTATVIAAVAHAVTSYLIQKPETIVKPE